MMKRYILFALADLFLLLLAFGLTHLLNYQHLNISETSYHLLRFQIFVFLAVSLAARKFTRIPELSFIMGAGLLLKTGLAIMFFLSLIIVSLQMMHFSRTMAYGTITILVILEIAALALFQWIKGPVPHPGRYPVKSRIMDIPRSLVLLDGALLVGAFFLITYCKRGTIVLTDPYDDILVFLLSLWLVSSLVTRKFSKDNFNNFFSALGPAIRTTLFMAIGLAFFIFLLRLGPISRFQAFGPLPLFLVLEMFIFSLYVNYRKYSQDGRDIEDAGEVRTLLGSGQDRVPLDPEPQGPVKDPVDRKLKHALEFFDPKIFDFLSTHVDLGRIDRGKCALLSTDNMFNLQVYERKNMNLIINLHKINDIRWFNRYFLLGHEKLKPGGYLVGKAHTFTTHRDYFHSRYPRFLSTIFYSLSFTWGRVFPKLPWLKKFYFAVTKGRNRMVSRAEILGRLCFCGYEIVAEQEIGHRFFFIARKISRPCVDENPTFGPLVRLRRSGLGGKPITVYKFRTMYPFSEYLQKYVYENHSLKEGGKFKDDYRVTGWGAFMRKTWLDELPMLYNWVRGDLRLVGVRPLSSQYLELYTQELRELRQKVKPGLLPPFYADMPTTLQEIMDSERRYIESYLRQPLRTQVRYFIKCVYNIVIKRKRSG